MLGNRVWVSFTFFYTSETDSSHNSTSGYVTASSIHYMAPSVQGAFSALTLLVGRQEGYAACKTDWWGASVVNCMEQGADLYTAQLLPLPLTVSCISKIQIVFTFRKPDHTVSSRKRAVKRVCV